MLGRADWAHCLAASPTDTKKTQTWGPERRREEGVDRPRVAVRDYFSSLRLDGVGRLLVHLPLCPPRGYQIQGHIDKYGAR